MKICLIFINFNDRFYLPFIAKHYEYVDHIIMFDNYSTDNSVQIAESLGFEVRTFGVKGQLNDHEYLKIKNHAWKQIKGYDYFIVVDADEFLVIDDLKGTLPKVQGYNMVSDLLPKNEITEINTGYEDKNYSKRAIFSSELKEIDYDLGCHKARPKGRIDESGSCRLLHYRCIGGFNRLWDRHQIYQKRMSRLNLKYGWGKHYLTDLENKKREWEQMNNLKRELW